MGQIQIEAETIHMIAGNIKSAGNFSVGKVQQDTQSEISGLSDAKQGIDALSQLGEELNSVVDSFSNSLNMMADKFSSVDFDLGNQIGE